MTFRFAIETYRRETGADVRAHRPIARREFHAATIEFGLLNIAECLKDVFAASAELGFGPLAVRTVFRVSDAGSLTKEAALDDIKRLRDRVTTTHTEEGWEDDLVETLGRLASRIETETKGK